MKLINFVKILLPNIEKSSIQEDLRITSGVFMNTIIPTYNSYSDFFKVNKLKSKSAKKLNDDFYKEYKPFSRNNQSNFISEINKILPNILDNINYLIAEVEQTMTPSIVNNNLDSKKVIILRAVSCVSYLSSYLTTMLNYVTSCEIGELSNTKIDVARKEEEKVMRGMKNVARLLSDYGVPEKIFSKKIIKLPSVIVNLDNNRSSEDLYENKKLDPFESRFITGFTGNPIFSIRLVIAEWQTKRYNRNKDIKKVLELKLLNLKEAKLKKTDPGLEKEIDYIQNRINKISKYLDSFEEDIKLKDN